MCVLARTITFRESMVPHHVNISLDKIEGAEQDGALKNGVEVPDDEILLFLWCWHWGPYMDPDQQRDSVLQ
jgi:hypothetical protein